MASGYRISAAALVAALVCAAPAPAQRCDGGRGVRVADLGFDHIGGSMSVSHRDGERPRFEFGGEPVIGGVRGNGPLREGDAIVAVDGHLITTREGGRRYTAIDPGEQVRLSVRRCGRVKVVTVRAGVRCMRMPEVPAPPAPPAGARRPGSPPAP
ncbi:MAG: hypothetical protein KY467_14525, partial [Gemmatimonadetes bacterium]|nr:hypothetical protein [Gemmatimonadota bacterium]